MRTFVILCGLAAMVAVVLAQGGGGGDGHHHHQEHHHQDHHYEHHHHQVLHNKHEKEVKIHAHPHYHYKYEVADKKHHDFHGQHEERDGYKVKGEYRLVEPDGKHVRVVQYESDKKQGFRANVKHEVHH